ncbi:MAG TPA: maleylpyruvate isomerase family mycothiol-dependent enzyme [Arthrobacter sp.]|nr:maleylpyruvate isomerase family mycothiol-dependent enzyme [Arthrobacter sp.]
MLPTRHLAELSGSLDTLSAHVRQPAETLAWPVPACPGWSLADLFGHVGAIERWAAEIVRGGKLVKEGKAPEEHAEAWFLDGAGAFLETMAALDPEAQCRTFGHAPHTAAFWLRRQAHEHAIHLVDACQASGWEMPAFAEDFLLDGVDEALAMFAPRQIRLERMAQLGQAVTFRVPDGTSWTLGEGTAAATISAPLREMYLGLWGRSNLADTALIEGDAELAHRAIRGPLTP